LVLVDSLQRGDEPDYEGLLELFPQNYHEPYYGGYTTEDFGAVASACGLTHIRDVRAFVSKVMVFDKPEAAKSCTRSFCRSQVADGAAQPRGMHWRAAH
jgi:hypothetical protein